MNRGFAAGPWRVEEGWNFNDPIQAGPDDGFKPFGGCGCCGSPWMEGQDEAQKIANARLIAAAPELYEACVELMGLAEREGWQHIAINKARAALAKVDDEHPHPKEATP